MFNVMSHTGRSWLSWTLCAYVMLVQQLLALMAMVLKLVTECYIVVHVKMDAGHPVCVQKRAYCRRPAPRGVSTIVYRPQ